MTTQKSFIPLVRYMIMKENPSENLSSTGNTGFLPQFEKLAKASDNALKNFADNANIRPTDWRILLPRAFYMDWSDQQTWQKSAMDPTIWIPIAFYPHEEKERALEIMNVVADSFRDGKSEEKQEEELKGKLQHIIFNINNNNTGKDHAGGSIMKHNKADENMAGGDIDKENTINDADKAVKENNK